MSVRVMAVAAPLLVGSGCLAHVALPSLPTKAAPVVEREQAFKELAPVGQGAALSRGGPWGPSFLLLGNGLRVSHAIDLLPAVDPFSPTAAFALASERKAEGSRIASAVSLGLQALACGLLVSGLVVGQQRPFSDRYFGLTFAGIAGALLSIIPGSIAQILQHQEGVEQRSAFITYPADLRRRLSLGDASEQQGSARPSSSSPAPPPAENPAPAPDSRPD